MQVRPAIAAALWLAAAPAAAETWVSSGDMLYDRDHVHFVARDAQIEVRTCYHGTGCDTGRDRKPYEPYYHRISCSRWQHWDWDHDRRRWEAARAIPPRTMIDQRAKHLCAMESSLPRK